MKGSEKRTTSSGCCGGTPPASGAKGGPEESAEKNLTDNPEKDLPDNPEAIVAKVRERYGEIASRVSTGCCGPEPRTLASTPSERTSEEIGYASDDLGSVPDGADLGLGCGAPVARLDLKTGETVLDLGSGAGVDVFIAARKVGRQGRVIGVDMTPEMIERARDNARKSELTNVEFREGRLEKLPLDDESVDAVTSNCVINLVPDKPQVFREVSRVLRPGGRLVISDIILDGELPESVKNDMLAYVGCVAGAMQRDDYFAAVEAAGLSQINVFEDVDVVAVGCEITPDQAARFSERHGVPVDAIKGKIRSVTFRAVK